MPASAQLHKLLDEVPEEQLGFLHRVIAGLLADPFALMLASAPLDDEPYPEHQRIEDAESIAEAERGETTPHEQILQEFGLL
ncbi:MAG: hypothetical protein HY822_09380 [Acidobacteria bacterium]|nr:hypothetical protein [Acidobacteriota bacterium]